MLVYRHQNDLALIYVNTNFSYIASLGTQEIRFGRKTNKIAKFSILDEKTKFTILDEIWTKNGQLIAEPNVVRHRGTSKRPHCAEHNLYVGGIFL